MQATGAFGTLAFVKPCLVGAKVTLFDGLGRRKYSAITAFWRAGLVQVLRNWRFLGMKAKANSKQGVLIWDTQDLTTMAGRASS